MNDHSFLFKKYMISFYYSKYDERMLQQAKIQPFPNFK